MNKLVRSLVHLGVSILFGVLLFVIRPIVQLNDMVVFGVFMIPGFILMQLGCDVLEDPEHWYSKLFHHLFTWLGGIIIGLVGFVGQCGSASGIEGQKLNPVLNGFLSPWLVTAIVAIILYSNINTYFHYNHIPFIPLISYGVGVALAMLFGVLGRYVMNIFYAWFPVIALFGYGIFLVIAFFKEREWYVPDFDELLNKKKKEDDKAIQRMLDDLEKHLTKIDPRYWKNHRNYPEYLTWKQSNYGVGAKLYYDSDDLEYKIDMPGKVYIDKNAVYDPINNEDELNAYCKAYIVERLKKILEDNPTVYGKKYKWEADNWANVSVHMTIEK
ncbi:MAG: hypothetical protein IKA02_02670 [Clostridia bacterium]|nr:hypothetical protein [Clostridia bacterium]